jgi:hypothetical protein
MKKHLFFTVCAVMLVSFFAVAQTDKELTVSREVKDPGLIIPGSGPVANRTQFKVRNPSEDKTEVFDVTGTGGAVFASSNTADGTANSFKHSLRINLALIVANSKGNNFQLVFYSESENIPFAASAENGMFSVYYPMSMYESIKQKLDQYLASKKKIQLKVIQKTNGYREGTLTF